MTYLQCTDRKLSPQDVSALRSANLLVRETKKTALSPFSGLNVWSATHEIKTTKHLCTDQGSKCKHTSHPPREQTPIRAAARANIFTSVTNLQRYIILDCVFIVCNVHISLQLFAHINKKVQLTDQIKSVRFSCSAHNEPNGGSPLPVWERVECTTTKDVCVFFSSSLSSF